MEKRITEFMRKVFEDFESIRGLSKADGFPVPFWDAVVLTAADEEQKIAFEMQIEEKLRRREIPQGIPYHCFSDPPGYKIGAGGSTFYTVSQLHEIYGEKFYDMKILLIHAGGQSQRLPSASVLGKIFTAMPLGNPMFQLFEIKLALYLPFLKKMSPGIFLCASDTIEVYNFDNESDWSFCEPGFTVLAHPSTIEIGKTHGVFILESPEKVGDKVATMAKCLQVIQKPSEKLMYDTGAVVFKNGGKGEGHNQDKPVVYSDSAFFFDHKISKKFLKFYREEAPLQCELCAYGDFHQPLGPKATIDYTNNTANVAKVEPKLVETRQKVFHLLKGENVRALVLNESTFYHFGTTKEYIYNLCWDEVLAMETGFLKSVFNRFVEISPSELQIKKQKKELNIAGCVMHSYLPIGSTVPNSTILEYCQFSQPIKCGANSILSNCCYDSDNTEQLLLPDNIFLHSVAIQSGSESKGSSYVTVLFGIDDNLKKKVAIETAGNLGYVGCILTDVVEKFNLPKPRDLFSENSQSVSLWFAEIFPVCDSLSESFGIAVRMVQTLKAGSPSVDLGKYKRISMAQILEKKDIAEMLRYRQQLYEKIVQKS